MHGKLQSVVLGSVLMLVSLATLQAQDVKQLVTKAAELSDSAAAKDDFSQIIEVCLQAEAQQLTAAQVEYFHKLEAWARNKRGELNVNLSLESEDPDAIAKHEAAALEDFDLAVQRNPKHWQALHNRGLSHAALGNNEKALADFDSTIRMNPKYVNAVFNRAEILYEQGEFAESLKSYQAVLKLDAKDVEAMTGQAHCLYRLENYKGALQAYSAAVKMAPQEPAVYANRADAYSDLGFWNESILDFRKALTIDRDLARAQQGLGWILATCPDESIRKPELALRFAQAAAEKMGESDFRYQDTLAAAQAAMGQFEEAKQRVSKALESAPKSEKPFLEYRMALYEKREPYVEPKR